jgi:hypothetical protein
VVELPNEVAACTTTITGAHPVPLAVTSGLTCLEHAVQDGHVTVGPGAAPLSGRQHRRGDRRRHPAVRACLGAGQHRDRADHRRRQHRQRVAVLRRQYPRTIRQRRRQHRHRGGHRAVRRPRQALTGPGSRIARRRPGLAWGRSRGLRGSQPAPGRTRRTSRPHVRCARGLAMLLPDVSRRVTGRSSESGPASPTLFPVGGHRLATWAKNGE